MAAGAARGPRAGQAAAPGGPGDASLGLGSAATWPLQRYARFLPPADGDDDDDDGQNTSSWKVFESNEESGHLILTIVVSGHFFISQGRTVLVCLRWLMPRVASKLHAACEVHGSGQHSALPTSTK